jgi:nucleoside phosphorylase
MDAGESYSLDDFTVGLICALPLELAAATAMLDEVYLALPIPVYDRNIYTIGRIGAINVVVSCCPPGIYGTTSSAAVAIQMVSTFKSLRFGLMVGIGGGVPSKEADIRLGDVVVSMPTADFGGVVQYDSGATLGEGLFKRTGALNAPPRSLLRAVTQLRTSLGHNNSLVTAHLSEMVIKYPRMSSFAYCGQREDQLFEADYEHVSSNTTCDTCDKSKLILRPVRDTNEPEIHYGLIGSGNQVIKHGLTRDKLAHQLGILCFEMEAAGLMNHFPCLVIRGICDYADSHKNKEWQKYAAATAAAYAKGLLVHINDELVAEMSTTSTLAWSEQLHSSTYVHSDYIIGLVCARPIELAAIKAIMDERHPHLPRAPLDANVYTLGRIGIHNVVVCCCLADSYGMEAAATVAIQMQSTFKSIKFGLTVGIGSGVPSREADIRLGDVVVSIPTASFGGVVRYDFGRTIREGLFQRTGTLNKPPQVLLKAVGKLQADYMLSGSRILPHLSKMVIKYPRMSSFAYCGQREDLLFEADYEHVSSNTTCDTCDKSKLFLRPVRDTNEPEIHYGLIGSGNQVIKHGPTRDKIAHQLGILCFEMEAAGLMDDFPCLVIRGICDYADSHKNKEWQRYAAATAAAYAKELLNIIPEVGSGDIGARFRAGGQMVLPPTDE